MPNPPDGAEASPAALAAALCAGDPGAVAKALNLIDDERPHARERARELATLLCERGASDRALRVGLTGPPGAGKSSLLDALVRVLRQRDQRVGIIAVDPSSRRSGGALLGDRVRVRSAAGDDGVFLRSMAARDRLGGVSDASYPSVDILAAAFDIVLVETVGVGQSESDVDALVDTLVFVLQPGAGDMLQFMKAGIIELPDIFAVNKADLGAEAERSASELQAGISLGAAADAQWSPPTLLVSARDGTGITALVDAIGNHRTHLDATGQLESQRAAGRSRFVRDALERRYGSYGVERFGGSELLRRRVERDERVATLQLLDEVGSELRAAIEARPEI